MLKPFSQTEAPLTLVERYLWFIVRHRVLVLMLVMLAITIAAVLSTTLRKDTSANAYIEPENPALRYREHVVETFGLKEPIVVVVQATNGGTILEREPLQFVRDLVGRLEALANIDAERVTSLMSQSAISGSADGLDIAPLLPDEPITPATIAKLSKNLEGSALHDGTLVAKDRSATVIVAELRDESRGAETYQAVMDLTTAITKPEHLRIHVAGAGAITGHFASYIDRDAGRLVPVAALGVSIVLFCAFFTLRASLVPMSIAIATIVVTLGAMAASDVPFYAITNGMIVVLMGISVAEPMHVFGEYYALVRDRPEMPHLQLVITALSNVWRPIALTSLTTVGGFFSLWVTSTMPPIRYFGLFGALGVVVAWLLTVTLLPAVTAMLKKRESRLMRAAALEPDAVSRTMLSIGRGVIRYPKSVLVTALFVTGAALLAASLVKVDHARIENFDASEPLYIADQEINRTLAGTNQLDIVIETPMPEGVLRPATLHKIERLEHFLDAQPEVGATTSIADYLKELNGAIEGGSDGRRIPNDPDVIAQLMLTYQASASPTEFESLIDSSARTALVRAYLRVDRWSEQKRVIHATQRFVADELALGDTRATLTGRVMLDYEWVRSVADGHVWSVIFSTLTVLVMCIVIFRSLRDGLLCLVPLAVSVVGVYAVMGLADIWLGVATSMFASIAIGLGIDFAIHMIERARKAALYTSDIDEALLYVYRSTGRAVLFNAAAVGLGFGIVMFSAAPPVRMFGVLVATAMVGAFIAAVTVLPAILKWRATIAADRTRSAPDRALQTLLSVVAVLGVFAIPTQVRADEGSAIELIKAVANRQDGPSADRRAIIRLIDRHGGVREQAARALRKDTSEGRRMGIFYEAPANIRGTSFLVHDYADPAKPDDQWLYLPAMRKVRRIPASDRGDYFLGTDLTFDEVRNDSRITPTDWSFRALGPHRIDDVECQQFEGIAANDRIARELGYSRARWCIDTASHIARRTEYWDRAGELLKTVDNHSIVRIDDIWSAQRIEVVNHKTGHRTSIEFRDVRFGTSLPDAWLTQQQMERGL